MLLGEYGVLYGMPALVCALDQWVTLTLTPRHDQAVRIESDKLGSYETDIEHLDGHASFEFILAALKQYRAVLRQGCDIHVESTFSDQVGFGSSAAVTTATLSALFHWINPKNKTLHHEQLLRQGRHVVRQVQGSGSGADIAASIYGGVVGYQMQPLLAERFPVTHPISAIYSGYKTKTADAIKQVQARFAGHPRVFRALANSIGQCAKEGIEKVRKGDWQSLGNIMNVQQGLMEALGVNTTDLQAIVESLRNTSGILGAKISGAGLGDCVIGLGEAKALNDSRAIPVAMSAQGVACEKI